MTRDDWRTESRKWRRLWIVRGLGHELVRTDLISPKISFDSISYMTVCTGRIILMGVVKIRKISVHAIV